MLSILQNLSTVMQTGSASCLPSLRSSLRNNLICMQLPQTVPNLSESKKLCQLKSLPFFMNIHGHFLCYF